VATISSHDTPTLRMWWDEDYERTQDYFNNILHREGTAPHPMPGWLATEIINRHLQCPSMLCVISLQDWLATDETLRLPDASAERVNVPANPQHYWRYRMHLNIEDLMEAKDFNDGIHTLIMQSRRK
jgi:4-alpha-glucanotransferase